jgi:hypothetical protein
MLAHSMIGFFKRAIWAGDASKPVTFESVSLEANLTKFIDDVVPSDKSGSGEYSSRVLAQQVRAFYDRTSRAVTGKIRRPFSAVCYTANCTINDDDKAFQSRLLTIPFKELKFEGKFQSQRVWVEDKNPGPHHRRTTEGEPRETLGDVTPKSGGHYEVQMIEVPDDPDAYNKFLLSKELMSALLPDLQLIGLYNGKLDRQAIQDWATFLSKAIGKKRDRNVNEWAKVSYIMALLNLLFQGGKDEQDAMFEWLLVTVTRQTHVLCNHAGVLDQFIVNILHVFETIGPNPTGTNPDKLLHWHNIRTKQVPPLCGGSLRFWAIRVPKVCHVLKVWTGKTFKEADVYQAVKDSSHGFGDSRCKFYDTDKCGWPIKKSLFTDIAGLEGEAPMAEADLLDSQLKEQRCVFIQEDFINRIRSSLDRAYQTDVDYKTIVIESANREAGQYNFYEALVNDGWFGYRSLGQGTFRAYSGATNEVQIGSPTSELKLVADVEMETHTCGFKSIAHCFQPATLLEFFTYQHPTHADTSCYPPCYTRHPFHFRNDHDDEVVASPMGDMATEPPSLDASPAKKPRVHEDSPHLTGMSPNRRRLPPSTAPSPLAPRGLNTPPEAAAPMKRRRASPSNHACYPRPPDSVISAQTARQWIAHMAARTGRGSQFVVDEAEDDEDAEKV